jgi:DNA-binding GntR family transcriptional regulator
VTPDDSRPLSLTDEAYAALRNRIVNCELAPGLRVTEKQLAAELGIGLTPVRQALARLDGEGLVRTLPRRGYQITPLTIESVNELFEVWRIIGPAIAELAARNMPPQARIAVMAEVQAKIKAAARDDGQPPVTLLAEEAWLMLAQGTGNRRLVAHYVQLMGELRRVFTLVFQDPGAAGALGSLTQYEDPDDQNDPAKVRANTERFIDTAHREVLGILTSWPSVVQAEVVPPVAMFLS